jgi:hypothetical protein
LRATRAISEHSVPIIAIATSGAGAVLRLFGPESMDGKGDIGPKFDAEVALSESEIGREVHIFSVSYHRMD